MAAINKGHDYNFFQKITVSSDTFGDNADLAFGIKNVRAFTLANEGSNGVIQYSFNGTTIHGDMTPGKASEAIAFDNRCVSKIWFRLTSGTASVVRVEAWSGP